MKHFGKVLGALVLLAVIISVGYLVVQPSFESDSAPPISKVPEQTGAIDASVEFIQGMESEVELRNNLPLENEDFLLAFDASTLQYRVFIKTNSTVFEQWYEQNKIESFIPRRKFRLIGVASE